MSDVPCSGCAEWKKASERWRDAAEKWECAFKEARELAIAESKKCLRLAVFWFVWAMVATHGLVYMLVRASL